MKTVPLLIYNNNCIDTYDKHRYTRHIKCLWVVRVDVITTLTAKAFQPDTVKKHLSINGPNNVISGAMPWNVYLENNNGLFNRDDICLAVM